MMSTEEDDFMAQLLGSDPGRSGILLPFLSNESCHPDFCDQFITTNNNLVKMDCQLMEGNTSGFPGHIVAANMETDDFLNEQVCNDSKESRKKSENVLQVKNLQNGMELAMLESKKRSCIPREVQRNKKNPKLKKCDDTIDDNYNTSSNSVFHKLSCCSENESNGSHELNSMSLSSSSKSSGALNRKTRASRGSATGHQNLYARKRRERINERLRILQNLVPNGTKVDISTMLEEAVQYVKFLQLQIMVASCMSSIRVIYLLNSC